MKVQLDWQVADEAGEWEPIVTVRRRPRLKVPCRVWGTLLALFLLCAVSGYVLIHHRYQEALRQAAFQIQGAIDQEALALARGDPRLFLAQQDQDAADWVSQQIARLRPGGDVGGPFAPARVEQVELRGDFAWVEVIAEGAPVRQVRFYRQTGLGWKHTAPRPEFWRHPVEQRYGNVVVRCDERDLPYIGPLLEQILRVADDVDASLASPSDTVLRVDFLVRPLGDPSPRLFGDRLSLASPWLTGIPLQGTWDGAYLEELAYWVAYGRTAQSLRSEPHGHLTLLQRALVDEYAALYAGKDLTAAPILREIAAVHGAEALPDALYAARDAYYTRPFFARWLSLPGGGSDAPYYGTLDQMAMQATSAGRRDSYRLLEALFFEDYGAWCARIEGAEHPASQAQICVAHEQLRDNWPLIQGPTPPEGGFWGDDPPIIR